MFLRYFSAHFSFFPQRACCKVVVLWYFWYRVDCVPFSFFSTHLLYGRGLPIALVVIGSTMPPFSFFSNDASVVWSWSPDCTSCYRVDCVPFSFFSNDASVVWSWSPDCTSCYRVDCVHFSFFSNDASVVWSWSSDRTSSHF